MNTPTGYRSRLVAGALLLAVLTLQVCHGRVQRLSLTELRDRAERIIIGTVVSRSTRSANDGNLIWTDYSVSVDEVLKGSANDTETVSVAGGEMGGVSVGVLGVPRFTVGGRYLLFLLPDLNYAVPTIGWGQGVFRLHTSESRTTMAISEDGEPLLLTAGGLSRGARLRVDENGSVLAETARALPDGNARASDPLVLDAQGNIVPQPPGSQVQKVTPPSPGDFATLDSVRWFVKGQLREASTH